MRDFSRVLCHALSSFVAMSAMVFVCAVSTFAQSYHVLYNFTGGVDGNEPWAGLTMDVGGNLYGTAANGGSLTFGTIFKLTHHGASWLLVPLHQFTGSDGKYPITRVVFGPNGSLYGTTGLGGQGCGGQGCGTLYNLKPPTTICPTVSCPWTVHVVHYFSEFDGYGYPPYSEVTFGPDGGLYGTTYGAGPHGFGSVYRIGGGGSGPIYGFTGGDDGVSPQTPVILDAAGNVFGTTSAGFTNSGAVFELANTQSGFQLHTLHQFHNQVAYGGLIFDSLGNLFGTTSGGGSQGGGIVFELTGLTNFSVLWNIAGLNGGGPVTSLVRDASGNFYGVNNSSGSHSVGSLFKLSLVGGVWTYTVLHDFSGPDGAYPSGPLVIDAQGNIFGAAARGGGGNCSDGCGLIFEITPN
jgi:uncharacterized repeat protein (TIGR03803 family)